MNVIWDDVRKKSNISDSSFENMIINSSASSNMLSDEDKDFILTSFNAKMYNYVIEYIFNKSVKVLQDTIFSMGEDTVVNVTHWIDRTVVSNFFDVFVLRLAFDLGLIDKQEKITFLSIIEYLQAKKEALSSDDIEELNKEKTKYYIACLFEMILSKNFSPFVNSIKEIINQLTTQVVLVDSPEYEKMVSTLNIRKNILIKILFSLAKTCGTKDKKELKNIAINVKNLFPALWENTNLNERKFFSYYYKTSNFDESIKKVFEEIVENLKTQEFTTDISVVTQILKSCQDILSCHYSIRSHIDEVASLIKLSEIKVYPKFFLRSVITPSLVTYLGNNNGYIRESREVAEKIFDNISPEKWTYYFKNFFFNDDFILINLISVPSCIKDFCSIIKKSGVNENEINDETIRELIIASKKFDIDRVKELSNILYFGD